MQLIFLGPPGAGKGTQASTLAEQWEIPHISTGDILRQAIAGKTSLGIRAQAHVDAGELVPDILIMALMRERFGQSDLARGWILDGFPRNLSQAHALEELLLIMRQSHYQVVNFEVSAEVLVERMLQRGRQDDNEQTIRRRLEVYQAETSPLIAFYQRRRCLKTVDGNLSVPEVNRLLQQSFPLLAAV
jgi:adenylate kinase